MHLLKRHSLFFYLKNREPIKLTLRSSGGNDGGDGVHGMVMTTPALIQNAFSQVTLFFSICRTESP
jgi:hypothetical protein